MPSERSFSWHFPEKSKLLVTQTAGSCLYYHSIFTVINTIITYIIVISVSYITITYTVIIITYTVVINIIAAYIIITLQVSLLEQTTISFYKTHSFFLLDTKLKIVDVSIKAVFWKWSTFIATSVSSANFSNLVETHHNTPTATRITTTSSIPYIWTISSLRGLSFSIFPFPLDFAFTSHRIRISVTIPYIRTISYLRGLSLSIF